MGSWFQMKDRNWKSRTGLPNWDSTACALERAEDWLKSGSTRCGRSCSSTSIYSGYAHLILEKCEQFWGFLPNWKDRYFSNCNVMGVGRSKKAVRYHSWKTSSRSSLVLRHCQKWLEFIQTSSRKSETPFANAWPTNSFQLRHENHRHHLQTHGLPIHFELRQISFVRSNVGFCQSVSSSEHFSNAFEIESFRICIH